MNQTTVPLGEIFLDPSEQDSDLHLLVEHIRENGQLEPVHLAPSDKHTGYKYIVIRGNRRIASLKILKSETVNAFIHNVTEEQIKEMTVVISCHRH